MEPFKNIYNKKSIAFIADSIKRQCPSFQDKKFKKYVLKDLEKLELKQRVNLIAEALHETMPYDYKKNIEKLIKTLPSPQEHLDHEWQGELKSMSGFLIWPYCTYVEKYGLEEFETSLEAMLEFTQRFSAEFVIRHFINKYESKMFDHLKTWKKHPNHHVRRLVSEGTRPRLPWGISVPYLKENLSRNIQLIKSLRKDPSLYVRRSVANHLNDISHMDPELFFETIESFGTTPEENYIKRHSSRTMLKKAHPRALKLHGYFPVSRPKISFKLSESKIKEGDSLPIKVKVQVEKKQNLLLEYIIYYKKANNDYSEKVFRLRDVKDQNILEFEKNISFKKVSTRKHYPGIHYIQLQLNGVRFPKKKFELLI
ncbi:MAG: hypothetical protein CME65_13485 [Halobacteriovoraceae bacterium]|nr:hypothetical protein [Halobacteriovoraceae bacterium]|tara:strand:- start:7376 stop:8482 length:1107 start_codon:yes stop_codon:yes gene_type:complete